MVVWRPTSSLPPGLPSTLIMSKFTSLRSRSATASTASTAILAILDLCMLMILLDSVVMAVSYSGWVHTMDKTKPTRQTRCCLTSRLGAHQPWNLDYGTRATLRGCKQSLAGGKVFTMRRATHRDVVLAEVDPVGDGLKVLHGNLTRLLETLSHTHGVQTTVQQLLRLTNAFRWTRGVTREQAMHERFRTDNMEPDIRSS